LKRNLKIDGKEEMKKGKKDFPTRDIQDL